MGLSKSALLEHFHLEHAYSPIDRAVCPACVTDPYLSAVLAAGAREAPCSYCGATSSADVIVLQDEINLLLQLDCTDPANELPYESREGGYIGKVNSGSDFVYDLDPWTECNQLLDDVAASFAGSFWCRRDYFGLGEDEIFNLGWRDFSRHVKHRSRFLLLPESEREDRRAGRISPNRMLRALGKLFIDFNLFTQAVKGTEYIRARIVKDSERPSTAEELGTAPPAKALASRMSPAGISMFYAACDDDTAVLETYEHKRGESRTIALARFQTLRPLILLDLTDLPSIPSQFDFESRPERPSISFLRDFEMDFTKPIKRDRRVHIEYVPTQIVTEFVRYRLRTPDNRAVDGIVYGSARNRGSKAVVIFADPEDCGPRADRRWSDPAPFLELTCVRHAQPQEFEHLWPQKGNPAQQEL